MDPDVQTKIVLSKINNMHDVLFTGNLIQIQLVISFLIWQKKHATNAIYFTINC